MTGAVWVDLLLAAALAATTVSCVMQVLARRTPRDLALIETTMGTVMITMLLGVSLAGGIRTIAITAFAVAAPWCAFRVLRASGAGGLPAPRPVAVGAHHAQQTVLCVAMVAMLAVAPASMSMSMPGNSRSGGLDSTSVLQVAVWCLLAALVVGAVRDAYRLVRADGTRGRSCRWPMVCRFVMVAASAWMLLPLAT